MDSSLSAAAVYARRMSQGLRYHHVGIPTTVPREGERYLPHLKVHVSGYESSAYGVEWMRFDADCPLPELVKTIPHVAFEVDDLQGAIAGKELLIPPTSPAEGVTVAFVVENGAPVEFIQISAKTNPDWLSFKGGPR
jgi:hypothetical protein